MKIKKQQLLEKIGLKREITVVRMGKNREWVERKQSNWRKFREVAEIDDEENEVILNKLVERIPVREIRETESAVKEDDICEIKTAKLNEPKLISDKGLMDKVPVRETREAENTVIKENEKSGICEIKTVKLNEP